MARRSTKVVNQVLCERGITYVDCPTVNAIFRYRWWWFKINPRLLFPSMRREHRKLIIANGKRKGWAEMRSGLIPLSKYNLPGQGFSRAVRTFIRKTFGLCCKRYEKGYSYVAIGHFRYVVLQHTTEHGLHVCEVYDKHTEDQIGNFIFNQDFTEVYPHTSSDGVTNTLNVIIGYVADSMVYSLAAGHLEKIIKISV